MNTSKDLLMSELFFVVISAVALMVAREFSLTRDGILRKLMIWYFSVEIYVYLASGLYFYLIHEGAITMTISTFRLIVLFPKVIMMCRILYYLKNKK